MKTSERLLNASKTIWDAYNEHPFVLGIQNGTLERDKFRYYIMQDFLYLKDYAKTYAVGVAKAKKRRDGEPLRQVHQRDERRAGRAQGLHG